MQIVVACRSVGNEGASIARIALGQARELARAFDVTVVSEQPPPARYALPFERIRPAAWTFLRRFAHVPLELSFARAVRRKVRALRPDFVVCHSHVVGAHLAGVAPYAVVVNGDIFERPYGTYDARLTALYRRMTPRAYRNAAVVVIVSPAMRSFAISGGAREEAIELIPNGIDPDELGPLPAQRPTEHRVLYVGRLAPEKGVEDLIEAIRITRLPLTIVGSGPLERELRAQGAHLPIDFVGPRLRSELGALYASHSVTCVPSISDPLPTVVLESLLCGTPVVGARAGGIPWMVEDGVNGLVVEPRNRHALAAALAKRDELARMAPHTRASVLPRFSWETIGQQLRDAIARRV
jgi:glycosyltransferase involved in cell wall biosynthesis